MIMMAMSEINIIIYTHYFNIIFSLYEQHALQYQQEAVKLLV